MVRRIRSAASLAAAAARCGNLGYGGLVLVFLGFHIYTSKGSFGGYRRSLQGWSWSSSDRFESIQRLMDVKSELGMGLSGTYRYWVEFSQATEKRICGSVRKVPDL